MITNAVIHITSEQPLVADLFEMPTTADVTLRCTNLRTINGKRPVFADDQDSIFFFPWILIRFLEIPPTSQEGGERRVMVGAASRSGQRSGGVVDENEPDLEIDEDFLRRIRDI